jgi:hypothetical protein
MKVARSNQPVVLQARKALDMFKMEIAAELGGPAGDPLYEFGSELGRISQGATQSFMDASKSGYFGYVSSRDCGAVGGHMTRRMTEGSEAKLMQ